LPSTRTPGNPLERLGDRPLVVLAEEHDRGVEDAGPYEGLVDVTLTGGAVAEERHRGTVGAVALQPHRVPRRVQRLRADHDRVQLEALVVGVPAALAGATEQPEQRDRVDALAERDAVLPVGREGEVLGGQRAAGAHLRGLLPEQAGPQAELTLALQGHRFGVDPADQDEVAVERLDLVVADLEGVVRVLHPLALGREQLDELRTF
jgi:hypothetical protein